MNRSCAVAIGLGAGVLLAAPAPGADGGQPGSAPERSVPYGEGTVYRREVLFGSFATGNLDGPATEVELYGAGCCRMPNGDWYILEEDVHCGLYKYERKRPGLGVPDHVNRIVAHMVAEGGAYEGAVEISGGKPNPGYMPAGCGDGQGNTLVVYERHPDKAGEPILIAGKILRR